MVVLFDVKHGKLIYISTYKLVEHELIYQTNSFNYRKHVDILIKYIIQFKL